jgi:aspartate/methionine/tyrosine aminotransferase
MFIRNKILASPTVAINSLVQKKKAAGERIYNLSIGEPMIPTHTSVVMAAENALRNGYTHYAPGLGIPELRIAASEWMNRVYKTQYQKENTVITCGGKFGLYALARTVLGPDDEATVVAPFWPSYPSLIEMTGARVNIAATQEIAQWKISPDDLRNRITQKTRVIFFNNACNPTGALYTRDEMQSLLQVAAEKNILFISDEVYSGLTYEGEFISAGSFPEFKNNVVVVQSVSKHFAMTGWRVGVLFGSPELIAVLGDWQSQSTTGTSTISQWAAVTAFQNGEQISAEINAEMRVRRDALVEAIRNKLNVPITSPMAGLYVLVSMEEMGVEKNDSIAFCEELLTNTNVALVPGQPFGAEGYVRMSFGGAVEEITEAVDIMAHYLKKK